MPKHHIWNKQVGKNQSANVQRQKNCILLWQEILMQVCYHFLITGDDSIWNYNVNIFYLLALYKYFLFYSWIDFNMLAFNINRKHSFHICEQESVDGHMMKKCCLLCQKLLQSWLHTFAIDWQSRNRNSLPVFYQKKLSFFSMNKKSRKLAKQQTSSVTVVCQPLVIWYLQYKGQKTL